MTQAGEALWPPLLQPPTLGPTLQEPAGMGLGRAQDAEQEDKRESRWPPFPPAGAQREGGGGGQQRGAGDLALGARGEIPGL